jgi:hypothetical protein
LPLFLPFLYVSFRVGPCVSSFIFSNSIADFALMKTDLTRSLKQPELGGATAQDPDVLWLSSVTPGVLPRALQRNRIKKTHILTRIHTHTHTHTQLIYFKVWVHMIMKGEQSYHLPPVSWRPRRASGVILSQDRKQEKKKKAMGLFRLHVTYSRHISC